MTASTPTWTEKTVEWLFAQSLLKHDQITAAPLSGNAEYAEGDARISHDEKFAVIEFKRTSAHCYDFSELKKYARDIKDVTEPEAQTRFDVAKAKLERKYLPLSEVPHLFVYGKFDPNSATGQRLSLEASHYWNNLALSTTAFEAIKSAAWESTRFTNYVTALAKLRYYKADGGGGGGGDDDDGDGAGHCVLGFKNGNVTVMSIGQYARMTKKDQSDNEDQSKPESAPTPAPDKRTGSPKTPIKHILRQKPAPAQHKNRGKGSPRDPGTRGR